MKKFLIASAFATLAVTAIVSTASAQQAGGPNGRGNDGPSSTDGGHGGDVGCLTHVCDPQRRPKPKKIVQGEGCGCTIKKVRTGAGITYIQDCYYFDVKANMERYCQPWQRQASN